MTDWGYHETLKALRARKGWRYQQARELSGTKFDSERFDRDEVNTAPWPLWRPSRYCVPLHSWHAIRASPSPHL